MAPEEPMISTSRYQHKGLGTYYVCLGGNKRRSGKIFRMINHLEKILQKKLDSWISYSCCHLTDFSYYRWKQSKKYFPGIENKNKYIFENISFFTGIIRLLYLFHWNIEIKILATVVQPAIQYGIRSKNYLQGCVAAYNFLHPETIWEKCLVLLTLQTRQVMDITGTYWQHYSQNCLRPPVSIGAKHRLLAKSSYFGNLGVLILRAFIQFENDPVSRPLSLCEEWCVAVSRVEDRLQESWWGGRGEVGGRQSSL